MDWMFAIIAAAIGAVVGAISGAVMTWLLGSKQRKSQELRSTELLEILRSVMEILKGSQGSIDEIAGEAGLENIQKDVQSRTPMLDEIKKRLDAISLPPRKGFGSG